MIDAANVKTLVEDDNLSVMDQLALLPEEERESLLESLSDQDLGSAELWLRPNQLEILNTEEWIVLFMAGRGAGKTRVGAHWVIEKARVPGTRIALLGRTVADVRDVMVQGESGILAVSTDGFMPEYMPSVRRLVWPNGSSATTYTSESPSQLRGPQQHCAWADEIGAFKQVPDSSGLTAWDNLQISTRLGESPQILATTTPKRTAMIRELTQMSNSDPERVKLITGSTFDNKANLSESYIRQIHDMYAGTALERQELFGELVDEIEGALWREKDILRTRLPDDWRDRFLPIISVDPSVTAHGDETGIVVVLTTLEHDLMQRQVIVCEDLSLRGPPEMWAPVVADAYARWNIGRFPAIVVAEGNQGDLMIRPLIAQENPAIPLAIIRAVHSKEMRAQPVSFAYVRGRVTHMSGKDLTELEQEMLEWEAASKWSPNRLDAMVHGVRSAIIDPRPLAQFAPILIGSQSNGAALSSGSRPYRSATGRGLRAASWRLQDRRGGMR